MTQSAERHSTHWFSKRRLRLLVVWGAFAAVLLTAWPVEPRLTLGKGEYLDVVGITSGSHEVITLTERAIRRPDMNYWNGESSGPVNAWSLKTGKRRSFCVPGQACSGRLIRSGSDRRLLMEEPNGLVLGDEGLSIGGDQIFLSQRRKNDGGGQNKDLMVLNFKSGDFKRLQRDREPHSHRTLITGLSPRGRWYLESIDEETWGSLIHYRIIEFGTEKEMLRFRYQSDSGDLDWDSCYSLDDSHFACCYADGKEIVTRIWNVEVGGVVSTSTEWLHGLTFSHDHRFLAGFTFRRRDHNPESYFEILVLDVQTAQVVHRLQMDDEEEDDMHIFSKLKFVDNDRWLLWARIDHPFRYDYHIRFDHILSWNLESNEQHCFDEPDTNIYLPDTYRGFSYPETLRYFVRQNHDKIYEAFEITTGRKVATLPPKAVSIRITPEVLLVEQEEELWLSLFLQARGITIPRIASSMIPQKTNRWLFIDMRSGRTICSIPQQNQICWLTTDHKTLVTRPSNSADGTFHVWDFPPRRSLMKPLLWSLLVPGIVVIGSAWKYRRRFMTRTTRPKLSPGAESTTLESS